MEKTIDKEAEELPIQARMEILKEKKQAYFRSRFNIDMDYKIALRLNDEKLKEQCLEQLKRHEQVIDIINEEIKALAPGQE